MQIFKFPFYLFLKLDPAFRHLSKNLKKKGRDEFLKVVESAKPEITTFSYSTLGLRPDCDLLLWQATTDVKKLQDFTAKLLKTVLGKYLTIAYTFLGVVQSSTYLQTLAKAGTEFLRKDRAGFLIVYPFTKTTSWYLLGDATRNQMMREHIKIAVRYSQIEQVLAYSYGICDAEFILAYECQNLADFVNLVKDLRATKVRKYTLSDTPIFTCIRRPLAEVVALLG